MDSWGIAVLGIGIAIAGYNIGQGIEDAAFRIADAWRHATNEQTIARRSRSSGGAA